MAGTQLLPAINDNGRFDRNVFVNCPFDKNYTALLRPLLFTIIYLGLNPRIALESKNSGSPRIEKILTLIRESQYAIHDLSRNKAKKKGGMRKWCQRKAAGN